ncbi:hypothetical protein BJF90_29540 [Pseudonocardia sp. CNS-004]|nr:hypothetical protein BJF90_29540 [Pseudonocardia sp. CNS-004]
MHPHRLQQLVGSVPDTADADQRSRLLAHVQASDRCRVRVERVTAELERALDGVATRTGRWTSPGSWTASSGSSSGWTGA